MFLNHILGMHHNDGSHIRSRASPLFDQHFGLGLVNDDILHPHHNVVPLVSGYYRPWRHQTARHSGVSKIHHGKDGFKVDFDVQHFTPEEVTVKVVDNCVVVEGKHEERQDDHGFVSRQFLRRYALPDDVDPDTVTSKLSSDGVLTIVGPKKALSPPPANERVVPIMHTNTPALIRAQREPHAAPKEADEAAVQEKMVQ